MLFGNVSVPNLGAPPGRVTVFHSTYPTLITCMTVVNTDSVDHTFQVWIGDYDHGTTTGVETVKAGGVWVDESPMMLNAGDSIYAIGDAEMTLTMNVDMIFWDSA